MQKLAKITPGPDFKDNLRQLPAVDDVQRIELSDANGSVVARIDNIPGKQGSLAVYHYLRDVFGRLDAEAAEHGLAVFAEHTPDARNAPGAHPNIDLLFKIVAGGAPLLIDVIPRTA